MSFYVIAIVITVILVVIFFTVLLEEAESKRNEEVVVETEASWYSEESCRREGTSGIMANGKEFKDENFTCASWDYPFGTLLRVTNTENGKEIYCEVTDRGPSKRLYRQGRTLDLSKSAFNRIASLEQGVIKVKVVEI